MKTLLAIAIFISLESRDVFAAAAIDSPAVFVSTAWLAEHQNDPSVVILMVTQYRRDYEKAHIAGARFLWPGWMAMSNMDLSFELLPVSQLDTVLEGLGISNNSRIILCGINGNTPQTARMFATMDYVGMGNRTSILDGGIDAWKAEGRPLTKEIPKVKRTSFTPNVQSDAIVNSAFVKARLNKPGVTIVDARAPQFYSGTSSGGYPRPGHIPGAVNLYFVSVIDSANKTLPASKLKEMFSAAGVKDGNEIIVYCHIGQTASVDYAAARAAGYKVHLYDGSFEDWSGNEDLPIELPAPAKQDSTTKSNIKK